MKQIKLIKKTSGFTLVEVILYTGLSAMILAGLSLFIGITLSTRVENQAITEVENQGIQVAQLITQTIRNAEGVIGPLPGLSSSSLTLTVVATSSNPTIFRLVSSTIYIQEGSSSPLPLTSPLVVGSNLIFENLARLNTSSSIRVRFTLSHVNPGAKSEYDYTKTFISSASFR